jgi:alpha-aminoadipate carrier protein LysW
MVNYKCPECDIDIDVPDDAIDGEILSCLDCGEEFEVNIRKNKKIELKKMIAEREDWGE